MSSLHRQIRKYELTFLIYTLNIVLMLFCLTQLLNTNRFDYRVNVKLSNIIEDKRINEGIQTFTSEQTKLGK